MKTVVPKDFRISESVRQWAIERGFASTLAQRHEDFVDRCLAKGYKYVDWDRAFMTACRHDWARLGPPQSQRKVVAL